MGNCQAAEAATVVIENPNGRVERIYWSVSASKVMADNPGHYLAAVISTTTASDNCNRVPAVVKQLKLLKPDDTLHIGHVYRLVSFEEVLKEFASKKKTLGRRQQLSTPESSSQPAPEGQQHAVLAASSSRWNGVRGQWKPALQSIAEVGN